MRVEVISGRDIDSGLASIWRDLAAANPDLGSPYFCPQYTQLTAQVRDDVYVSVVEDGGRVVGLLPFQKSFGRVGRPVSGPMSDYQGYICAPGTPQDAKRLVKASGLDMWEFDHLLASQDGFRPHHRVAETSPIIDVSRGFDAYVAERKAAGSKNIKKIRRMARVLERDVGKVRYEVHSLDRAVFDQLVAWKRQQCQTTGSEDLFGHDWAHELLERIYATQDEDFQGTLTAVWAGDTLAAAHMGMRRAARLGGRHSGRIRSRFTSAERTQQYKRKQLPNVHENHCSGRSEFPP